MGLREVLIQHDKMIVYVSRQLKDYERNYLMHDLKLAIVVFARKIWRCYLYGVHCKIFTDHQSLKYFFTLKDLNMRQRRCLELVKDCNCEILYHPGKANKVADTLSRKSIASLMAMIEMSNPLRIEMESFNLKLLIGQLSASTITSTIFDDFK